MSEERAVLDAFLKDMNEEFPSFRIIKKAESKFAKAMDIALKVITFGGQREFMSRYYTVIGDTLYVPEGFDDANPIDVVITLRHERIHLRQRRRYTMVGMTIVYMLLPFPLFLAYGRARLEWEAYTETLRATRDLRGADAMKSDYLRNRIITQFTSPAYGWMWPFRLTVERWYDEAIRQIEAEVP